MKLKTSLSVQKQEKTDVQRSRFYKINMLILQIQKHNFNRNDKLALF